MSKKFYEVVFEGNLDIIYGMLEGFMLGQDGNWEWYSAKEHNIEAETFTEIIKEWASLKTRLHHIILEEEFFKKLKEASEKRGEMRFIKAKYIKSFKEIKSSSFSFEARAYAKKYGEEIKAILSKLPQGVTLEKYNPSEIIDSEAKGTELYAPTHDYTFTAEGIASGEFGEIIKLRKTLDDHPLVEVGKIKLTF